MALSKIVENSLADEAVSSAKLKDFSAAVDLNGVELVLDADADTSITADTDDRIDFKIAGVEHFSFSNSSGDTIIKPMVDAKDIKFQQFDGRTLLDINDGGFVGIANGATSSGEIRFFEDTDNGSNYVGLNAGSISSSFTLTLPTADGSSGQFLKTDGSGALSFDTVSSAADDLTAGDAAVSLTTTAGNITIDAQGNDTDIIFKGTDGSADTTFLTIDGSAAGKATFNNEIVSGAVITSGAGLVIADAGNIGSASDTDAIAIASNGVTTFSQNPVFPAGGVDIASFDIDGGTDIGANLADADLFIVDDGAGGTNRKMAASRIATYVGASAGAFSIDNLDIDGATDIGAAIVDADLFIIDDGAGGTNRKTTAARLKTYIGTSPITALNNATENELVTVGSTTTELDAEAKLISDGSGIIIRNASVGTATAGKADMLVIEGNASGDTCGMSILSANDEFGVIHFGDDGDVDIGKIEYDHGNNRMRFYANAQERLRITSSGEIGVNEGQIDTGGIILKVSGAQNNTVVRLIHKNTGSTTETLMDFRDGDIQQCGTINIAPASNTVSFNTSSDYRLKENESAISDGITRIKQLKPYRFNWIKDTTDTKVDGFFAHEVSSIVPEAIDGEKDEMEKYRENQERPEGKNVGDFVLDKDGNQIPKYQQIDQSKLVPVLTAALKESITKIEALEARVTTLEG